MATVAVFGIAVIDFVFQLDQLPAEPIKYRAKDAVITGGGCAANASVAIARLGGNAKLVARLGEDEIGGLIVSDLETEGVDCTFAARLPSHRSSFSSVIIDAAGERQIVNYRDTTLPDHPEWLDPDKLKPQAILADTRWPAGADYAMALAKELGVPGVLDAEDQPEEAMSALANASHVAFSENGLKSWAKEVAGQNQDSDPIGNLEKFSQMNRNWVCVTQGERGVTFLDGKTPVHVPAYSVNAVDTLGAGDVWHGAFALSLAERHDIRRSIEFANATAAIKCTRFGGRAGTPTLTEVEEFLKDHKA